MKNLFSISMLTILLLISSYTQAAANAPYALFSPAQGKKAFNEIYKIIREAEDYVHITIYSWSDSGIDKAMLDALKSGVKVKIVLHPPLAKKKRTIKKVIKLEAAGAEVKIAKQNMHEKFLLVDGKKLVNTSANMSSGAKLRYSEAFIFHEKTAISQDPINQLIQDFRHEFTILWNSSKDIITSGEGIADPLEDYTKSSEVITNLPSLSLVSLYSSSMNFKVKINKPSSLNYKKGKFIALKKRKDFNNNQTWKVRDLLIKSIDNANFSILCSLNHFNIRSVSDALIRAVKRGVEVRLAVDNQEYKSKPNGKEMSVQFIKDWKSLDGNSKKTAPVRFKYYSHLPSPRHWLLNHHKYILIDYDKEAAQTILLAGSYNISKNAEHRQFDNMVSYTSQKYKNLYKEFYDEFEKLWSLNRDGNDLPKEEKLNQFLNPTDKGGFRIHAKSPISLTWKEVKALRKSVNQKAKGIFRELFKKKDCLFYRPSTQAYLGCPK